MPSDWTSDCCTQMTEGYKLPVNAGGHLKMRNRLLAGEATLECPCRLLYWACLMICHLRLIQSEVSSQNELMSVQEMLQINLNRYVEFYYTL